MATKQDCMNAAIRAGATVDEARDIVASVVEEAKLLKAAGVVAGAEKELAAKIMQRAEAARVQTLIRRKQTAHTIRRRIEVEGAIHEMQAEGASFMDAMTALLVGSAERFAGSRASVSNKKAGIRQQWLGSMLRELEEMDGQPLRLLQEDRAFHDLVHQEMLASGSTGDAVARHTAGVFQKHLEWMRVRLNDAGATIGKIDGYAPQSHSMDRLRAAGETRWVQYILPRIDFEKSLPGVLESDREQVLREMFTTILTGQRRQAGGMEKGMPTLPRNMASSMNAERVLHFKDATSALEYHKDFGEGTIVQAVLGQLQARTGRLALMETFGTNPEAMLQSLIAGEARRLRNATDDEVALLGKNMKDRASAKIKKTIAASETALQKALDDGDQAGALTARMAWEKAVGDLRSHMVTDTSDLWQRSRLGGGIANYYAIHSGEAGTPVNPTLARVCANIRGVQAMAKLGAAAISAFADVFVKAVNLRHNGENLLGAWKNALDIRIEGMQAKERVELGRALGVYTNSLMGDVYMRFDVAEAPSGAVSRAMNKFFRFSGLEGWTEGHRAAYTMYLSSRLGDNAGLGFDGLNKDFAASLRRYGLHEKWDLLQKMVVKQEIEKGHVEAHMLPERAYDLTDADIEAHLPERWQEGNRPLANADPEVKEQWEYGRAQEQNRVRKDVATDLIGYYADETRYAVLEPDEKTRAYLYADAKPGTGWGEFRRFMLQFKGFPAAYTQRFLHENRANRASMGRGEIEVPGVIHAAVTGMAFGYLAMSAKDLVKGREPRSPEKIETWFAAGMQAGGLGLLGDFFLGTHDRFGNQALASVAGPIPTLAGQMATLTGMAARGEVADAGEGALRLAIDNTPFLNLFYTRAALDYLFLFHIREALSPGTLARTEQRLRKEYNQEFLTIGDYDLRPSKRIKRGGGFK